MGEYWCHRARLSLLTRLAKMSKFLMKGEGGAKAELRRRMEVRKYFNKADKNGDGKLTKEEWHKVLNNSGVPTTIEEVDEFFKDLDRDYDERLSFGEFLGEESHIEKIFKNMDKNGDGFVTKTEFKNVCQNLTTDQVEVAFRQFDTSGDDKLNYKEFCMMIIKREQERAAQSD